MYSIFRGSELVGRSRLERPNYLIGDVQGVFEPAGAFRRLRDRINARSEAITAELEREMGTGDLSRESVDDFRELALLSGRGKWPDLEVVSPDGRALNARVDGFVETSAGRWMIGVTVNDAEYWHRAAEGTL